jgi:AcrR family transcriptional regulator
MKQSRVDVGSIRREQIVQAAIAVIDEQGIQNLSLSEIEKKTGMRRGQLTYYFHTKESILLALFERLLQLMYQRVQAGEDGLRHPCDLPGTGWERFRYFLTMALLRPPKVPQFHSLQYTFLSQIAHRDDYRQALANLYGTWRVHMADDFAGDLARKPGPRVASPRAFATLVQALLHGLGMQRAADPNAFDPQEMLDLCLDVLGSYLNQPPVPPVVAWSPDPATTGEAAKNVKSPATDSEESRVDSAHPAKTANGQARRGRPRRPARAKRVNHDQRERP